MDSSEDVNKELRKVLDLASTSESGKEEPPDHPPAPTPSSAPKPNSLLNGLASPDKSLLASLSKSQTPPRDSKARPSHGGTRASLGDGKTAVGGGPVMSSSPLSSVGDLRDPLPISRPHIGHSPAQSSANTDGRKR